MSELTAYSKAMIAENWDQCVAIERRNGLYGYSPEVVSVGLRAIDEGRDADQSISEHLQRDQS